MSDALIGLPRLLAIAGKVGGITAVRGLAKAFGGRRTSIPKKAGDNHPLVIAAGRKAADAIMREYGGEDVQFPKGKRALTRLVLLELTGKSTNQVAMALGVTYRQALRLKSGGVKDGTISRRAADTRQFDIEDYLKRTR